MNRTILKATLLVVSVAMAILVFEGAYAIGKWKVPSSSIIYDAYRKLVDRNRSTTIDQLPRELAYSATLSLSELEAVVPYLKEIDAGLGNSSFEELVTNAAAVNHMVGGCLEQKANLRKTMTFLRTNLFNPLDPVTLFYDRDRTLPPEVQALIENYGIRKISHTTNAVGERRTLPTVTASRKVLIAGDSVANGSMIDDSETLASQLQASDRTRQYINIGIGGAAPHDIFCALEKAAARYPTEIEELVYVFCENDFRHVEDEGGPAAVVNELATFVDSHGIDKVTVVYAPYIYNIVPQFTRFRGYRGGRAKSRAQERTRLEANVRAAGYRYVDIADVALEEAAVAGSQFAVLANFVDHTHLSPHGTARLAERLREDP
jgi:hypothetical protein